MGIREPGHVESQSSDADAEPEALRMLARRPRTVQEIQRRLVDRGHDAEVVRCVVDRLLERNYLNDLELSLQFISTRAARLGHGRLRLVRELRQRGVEEAVADQAWELALNQGEVDPVETLRRRVRKEIDRKGGVLDSRGYRRVYNALLRAGFEPRSVRAELASHKPQEPHDDFS